ncbi:MAG: hypothetical protein LBT59_06580 [Clostridiales bacterium]|jgi:hypothetical protein|nr:hypothetical protein [Clostridiales bacterium]
MSPLFFKPQPAPAAVHVAFIGMPQSGKTMAISALAEYPERLLKFAIEKKANGTGMAVEYHFMKDNMKALGIERLAIRDIAKDQIPDPIKKALGFDSKSELDPRTQLARKIYSYYDIYKLLGTEGIDKVIKKITLEISLKIDLHGIFSAIDLYVTDASCFLNRLLSLEDNDKPSLGDLGLDGIDAAVLLCGTDIPDLTDRQRDLCSGMLSSVPLHMATQMEIPVSRTRELYEKSAQSLKINESDFSNAFLFAQSLGLIEDDDFSYKDLLGKDKLLLSLSKSPILKASTDPKEIIKSADYKSFAFSVSSLVQSVQANVHHLRSNFRSICSTGVVFFNNITSRFDSISEKIVVENGRYPHEVFDDLYGFQYIRPLLPLSSKNVTEFTSALDYQLYKGEIFGDYNGAPLTTWDHDGLGVLAVTAHNVLKDLISEIELEVNLSSKRPMIGGSDDIRESEVLQLKLIKLMLKHKLYSQFTDNDLFFHNLIAVKKEIIIRSVLHARRDKYSRPDGFLITCLTYVLKEFIDSLDPSYDIDPMFVLKDIHDYFGF